MRRLLVLPEVGSTNTWLRENADFHRPFTGVRAIRQTAGRGRADRSWHSAPQGDDLTCSFVVPVPGAAARAAAPLIAGMALYGVLAQFLPLRIKWPNDLLHEGRKLAGILCEEIPQAVNLAVVGIGVNVNSRVFPGGLAARTTSLALATGKQHSVQKVWLMLYRKIVRTFGNYTYPLPAGFIRDYNALAYRYIHRSDISHAPLEFRTLLADGRAEFQANGEAVVLAMAE